MIPIASELPEAGVVHDVQHYLRPGTLQLPALPPLSLYIHLPWCLRKCPYCDFNSHTVRDGIPEAAYIDALIADPDMTPGFIEETLRYLAPVNNMWRLVKQDTQLGGHSLKAGEILLVRYGSANRDEAHFPDADRFDPRRENAREHLSFGAGIHTCIGAMLARKEMVTAFPILLRRLKNPRLQTGQGEMRYSPNVLLRGVLSLDIAFDV